jgi:signal transduction histidine kinase
MTARVARATGAPTVAERPTRRQRAVDVTLIAIALGYTAWSSADQGSYPAIPDWYWPVDIGLGVLAAVSLWFARTHPVAVAVLLIVPGTLSLCAGFAVVAGIYRLGSLARPRIAIPIVAVHIVLALPYHWVAPIPDLTWLVWLVVIPLLYALSLSLGLLSRARRQVIEGLRRAALADRERYTTQLTTLRRDERERIAREMHDVLAHRISLLSVHAGALEFRTKPTAESDHRPITREEVHDASVVIRENAHLAVEDLRELLLVLRDADSAISELGTSRRQAQLDDVHGLVDEARRAGQHVEMTLDDAVAASTRASVQRTAYRIVQEGLTNARKHAPHSPVSIDISGDGERLHVRVRNPVAIGLTQSEIPGFGAGLAGLTERVRIDGGSLSHGLAGGVFALAGDLPMGEQ